MGSRQDPQAVDQRASAKGISNVQRRYVSHAVLCALIASDDLVIVVNRGSDCVAEGGKWMYIYMCLYL